MKGASGKVNNEKKQNEKFLKFFKNLKVVQNQKLFPCVVFSFSRKQCEELASNIDEREKFTSGDEVGQIKRFLK